MILNGVDLDLNDQYQSLKLHNSRIEGEQKVWRLFALTMVFMVIFIIWRKI
jgi:hypothetical protein